MHVCSNYDNMQRKVVFYLFLISVPKTFGDYCLVSNLTDRRYLDAIMGDHRVFGGADYDSDNSFYVSLPYDVMLRYFFIYPRHLIGYGIKDLLSLDVMEYLVVCLLLFAAS